MISFCFLLPRLPTTGAWVVFTPTNHDRDPVFGLSATGTFAMTVTAGFFLFECLALTWSDWTTNSLSKMLHLHHWLSLAGSVTVVLTEAGYTVASRSLTLEMSTPFSALCWMLLKAGLGRSWLWTVNQMVLLHAFHLRSVVECHIWWNTFTHRQAIWADMPWSTFLSVYAALSMFTFMATPYWGYKKTLQMGHPHDWNFENDQDDTLKNGKLAKNE
ncbi:protein CLN8-like [Aplysia californica]|uniref:Protein CLN8-like n=1 Tax=Aplysia californica TaxID=6500 RepID=A0ABM1A8A7_APLCA|nr:protein CLN8-like [Aplysia californica]